MMADGPVLLDRLGDRRRVVVKRQVDAAGARVGLARLVGVRGQVGQLDERMVLPHRNRRGRRRHLAHQRTRRAVGDQRDRRLDLRVLREALGAWQIDGGAAGIHPVRALVGAAQPVAHAMRIAQQEVRGVDEHAAVFRGLDLEAPEHRPREGVGHRLAFRGVAADRAEAVVGLRQQDLRADPLEGHDGRVPQLPAVEADRIGSEAGRERRLVEQFLIEPRDLEIEPAGEFVPVHRDEAVHARPLTGALADLHGHRLPESRLDGAGEGESEQRQQQRACAGVHRWCWQGRLAEAPGCPYWLAVCRAGACLTCVSSHSSISATVCSTDSRAA